MIRPPVIKSVGENFVIIEPPAGMLKLINNRIEQAKSQESKLIMLDYSSIFILACLHTQQCTPHMSEVTGTLYEPVAASIGSNLGFGPYNNLRSVFADASDEQFIHIINEFQFSYTRDVIDSIFDEIDKLCFITKKVSDDEKKD